MHWNARPRSRAELVWGALGLTRADVGVRIEDTSGKGRICVDEAYSSLIRGMQLRSSQFAILGTG